MSDVTLEQTAAPAIAGPGGGLLSLQPALQYLLGSVPVQAGQRYSLTAEHNTVALRYSLRQAGYSHLALRDASMPLGQFAMAGDGGRLQAYGAVLERAVRRRAEAGGLLRLWPAVASGRCGQQ
jgi:hypothetical protein